MEWARELAVVVGRGARPYCLAAASAGDLLGGCRVVAPDHAGSLAARERRSAVAWQQQGTAAALEAAVDEGVYDQ